jgi:hypothetical protein
VEELGFQLLVRRDMVLLQGGTSMKHWASVYFEETEFLVPPAE